MVRSFWIAMVVVLAGLVGQADAWDPMSPNPLYEANPYLGQVPFPSTRATQPTYSAYSSSGSWSQMGSTWRYRSYGGPSITARPSYSGNTVRVYSDSSPGGTWRRSYSGRWTWYPHP